MTDSLRDKLLKAGLAPTPAADPPVTPSEPSPSPDAPSFGPKVVVRKTKKGRGGKAVTLIQGVTAGHAELVDSLKRQLGTGGRLEGDEVVIHGDQVERVARWLESQGVARVVRG
ncbi:MAG: translation initiation factor [Deltaproteobacteria bacterium]|nr:MAG: translation initiation factor [Deltaproteobacteria bacterium]